MFTLFTVLFLIIGMAVGSFLNVIILRIDTLTTVLYERSHCPKCKKTLRWFDLIPFISFVLLRARCRYCGEKISWQYPAVEIGTGLLFAFLYTMFGWWIGLIYYLIIFSLLIVIFVYDIKTKTVPEIFVWITLAIAFLGGWYFGAYTFGSMLLGGIIAGGFLALLVVISKERWMGAGDIKIGLILGLLTGYPNAVVGLFLAFLLGSAVGIIAILIKKKTVKEALPFAPFLIISLLITMLYGTYLVYWYLGKVGFNYY